MDNSEALYFKSDAQVSLVVGTAFIQRLQELSVWMLSQVPEEELQELRELLEKGKEEFPEPWMTQFYTVAVLLREIQTQAQAQNLVYSVNPPGSSDPG